MDDVRRPFAEIGRFVDTASFSPLFVNGLYVVEGRYAIEPLGE